LPVLLFYTISIKTGTWFLRTLAGLVIPLQSYVKFFFQLTSQIKDKKPHGVVSLVRSLHPLNQEIYRLDPGGLFPYTQEPASKFCTFRPVRVLAVLIISSRLWRGYRRGLVLVAGFIGLSQVATTTKIVMYMEGTQFTIARNKSAQSAVSSSRLC
jgi:hypothetical protein